jgi:catechol 2,3-dioxygenase-like lactoylglutathione lyase family enzyme
MTAAALEPQSLDLPLVDSVAAAGPVRFHLSLNVADLARSIEFFRVFLDCEPAKRRSDYAKFELAEPPLVLSLEPFAAPPGGSLNHLGFRLPSAALLVECQRRLEMAGITTQREEGVECCYAKQTKFWVRDPDNNLWEVYTFEGDIEHRGDGHVPAAKLEASGRRQPSDGSALPESPPSGSSHSPLSHAPAPAIWNHRLGQPLPARLPILDATVDEVALQGTFNAAAAAGEATPQFLAELFRVLKVGGTVQLHVLTADRPLTGGTLDLPGPAAIVERVPVDSELIRALEDAGFTEIEFTKLGEQPCFSALGAELRETKIAARKPQAADSETKGGLPVMYKGPFREISDDSGLVFRRGVRTVVSPAVYLRLQAKSADSFWFSGFDIP